MSPFQRNEFPNMITILIMTILVYRKLPNKTAPIHIMTCICSIFIKICIEFLANIIHSCIIITTIIFHGLIFLFITDSITAPLKELNWIQPAIMMDKYLLRSTAISTFMYARKRDESLWWIHLVIIDSFFSQVFFV